MNNEENKKPEEWGIDDFERCRRSALEPQPQNLARLKEWIGRRRELISAYLRGFGTEPDHSRYFALLRSVAELEEKEQGRVGTDAMWELAYAFRDGLGVEANEGDYLGWLERAAELGDRAAMTDLAEASFTNKDIANFLRWTERLASERAKSKADLATAYRDGRGVAKDDLKYFECAQEAVTLARAAVEAAPPDNEDFASEDLPRALRLLADAYRDGRGVVQSDVKYFEYMKAAVQEAERGIEYVQQTDPTDPTKVEFQRRELLAPLREQLALAHREGLGTTKSLESGFRLMKRAAEEGSASAMRQLAVYYRDGIGVRKNRKSCFAWMKKSADAGDLEATYQIALAFGLAEGVDHEPDTFVAKVQEALQRGHPAAFMALGVAQLQTEGLINDGDSRKLLNLFTQLREETLRTRDGQKVTRPDGEVEGGIAHFTTLEALYSMLPKGIADTSRSPSAGKNLLRLYNIEYVNDPEEGKALLEIGRESETIRQFFSSERQADNVSPFEPIPLSGLPFSVYVGSFTLKIDRLDLWRAYGRDGTGYCLVTPLDAFFEPYLAGPLGQPERNENVVPLDLYHVRYGDEHARITLNALSATLNAILQIRTTVVRKRASHKQKIEETINRTVRWILSEILYLYKGEEYESEKEVRMLAPFPIKASPVQADTDTPARLFVETPAFFYGPGSEIIIGPKVPNPTRVRLDLKHRLAANDHTDVEVRLSKIRYR